MEGRGSVYEIGLVTEENVLSDAHMKDAFKRFIETFRIGEEYLYRIEISKEIKAIKVIVEHIGIFDQKLFQAVIERPLHALELFQEVVNTYSTKEEERYVEMVSESTVTLIRALDSSHLNKISTIQGIVLSVSSVTSRPVSLYIFCKTCMNAKMVKENIPKKCESCGGPETFTCITEKSILQDSQVIKIQESFKDLPAGEIPRHLVCIVTGNLVDKVVPGSTLTITGVYTIGGKKQVTSYIRVLGMETKKNFLGIHPLQRTFTRKVKEFLPLTKEKIIRSIAPEIFGHKDIKTALACALFGGVKRRFSDGIRIRGDINVLLLGDPGIAKSQMLKFLSGVSTRGVYTSGKGASAAGLTASVCKDKQGNFYLEGGALVLADGGICCIDEFDKMQEKDRVAIHEAMEQQTISISKAGIVTSLNSQCAVVAAANPIFGRYDENKLPGENINFGATILSRFDLVFVIKDNMISDKEIAWHVLTRGEREDSKQAKNTQSQENEEYLSPETLKEYAEYAKSISPQIEEEAAQRLQAFYVQTRRAAREGGEEKKGSIPITVRQLEAITRISEALARMELETAVGPEHVEEAIRLFGESTMKAVTMGHYVEGMPRSEWVKEFSQVEAAIRRLLPVGVSRGLKGFLGELCKIHSEGVVMRCVDGMIRGERLSLLNGGKTVIRLP
ncbi:DNA replication licensing factor MCM5 [Nematocida sp. LUAm3]|nr:DNA replication licensing factor MCM5 [Nematocida sp. LUAm3]KAI5174754.1 DNA replication licensing factor MCM5 [Nematocida sp. LUAm2]KAI5177835.1 DNA replication licensing factor MCM5 [Nematocida sp. LUAm1]